MMTLEIHTTGISKDNVGGWGYRLSYGGHTKYAQGCEEFANSDRMELMAVLEALKSLKTTSKPTRVYTDSWYVFNGHDCPHVRQLRNNDLWNELHDIIKRFNNIEFNIVKSESDISNVAIQHIKLLVKDKIREYDDMLWLEQHGFI